MATSFPCLSLFGTKDYSFLTETYKCFSARIYTCLEFRTDQNLFTRGRTKFTAISTRFMNLDCESPIHAALEHNYSNIYSDADTQTQIAHTRFTRKFLGGYFWAALLFIIVVVIIVIDMMTTIMMLMTMTMTTLTPPTRPPASVVVVIVIMTLTLNRPPLHQHQESDWLLVGFAAKVWCMQQKYQPLHFLPSLQIKANKKFKFVTGNMRRLMEWGCTVTC